MAETSRIDRRWAAFSLLVLFALGAWYVGNPETFRNEIRGPQTYVLIALMAVVLVTATHRGFRESWLYGLLFGAFTLVWGLHNLSGPAAPYLTGYGFVVLGLAGVVYAVYRRVRPSRKRSEVA